MRAATDEVMTDRRGENRAEGEGGKETLEAIVTSSLGVDDTSQKEGERCRKDQYVEGGMLRHHEERAISGRMWLI